MRLESWTTMERISLRASERRTVYCICSGGKQSLRNNPERRAMRAHRRRPQQAEGRAFLACLTCPPPVLCHAVNCISLLTAEASTHYATNGIMDATKIA